MGRDKVHGNKPLLERKLGVLKDSTRKTREVMLAIVATETSIGTSYTMVLSAMRANHIVTPTNIHKCLLANVLIVEVLDN